jgi:hypothetical protein
MSSDFPHHFGSRDLPYAIPGYEPQPLTPVTLRNRLCTELVSYPIYLLIYFVYLDSVDSVVNRRTIRVWNSGRGRDFFFHQEVHTGCEGHPASCSMMSRFLSGGRAVGA